jgi:chemotaxis protein CheD
MINVGMGEGVVASGPHIVSAAGIGSCVVVALYDGKRGLGGLAHIMLPDSASVQEEMNGTEAVPYRCADTAIAALLDGLRGKGARLQDLVAKMVGGARMFATYGNGSAGIGGQNIRSVKHILAREGIPLVGWDLAGQHARTVEFHLASGKLVVKASGQEDRQF